MGLYAHQAGNQVVQLLNQIKMGKCNTSKIRTKTQTKHLPIERKSVHLVSQRTNQKMRINSMLLALQLVQELITHKKVIW